MLNDQVSIEKLTPGFHLAGRFRTHDVRGEFAMIASNAEIQFVEIVEFLQGGVIRAGHYHNNYIEQIYVIKGVIRMYVKNLITLEQVSVTLESGSIATIHPGVAHLFSAVSNSLAVAMGAGSNPFVDRHTFDDFDLSETRAV